MSFEYVSVEDAIASHGVRMVVVPQVPSPWGESAKGIFHIKNIPFKAVRLVYDNEALTKWAGQLTGPVVIRDDEAPRSSWADILFLAERLAPERSLLPEDAADRVLVLGLAHELLGEDGLAWSRRLHAVHLGLTEGGGYGPKISKYLGNKYGYRPEAGAKSGQRVIALLKMLSARLHAQRTAGSDYLVGEDLTAADIYAACAAASDNNKT